MTWGSLFFFANLNAGIGKRFDAGMGVRDAATDIDIWEFKKWANWERILANVERLYREFKGKHPRSEVDFGTVREQMNQLARSW